MSDDNCSFRLEVRDWVALEVHRWERAPRSVWAWAWIIVAWLVAGYTLLGISAMVGFWIFAAWKGVNPPLDLPTTASVVVSEMAFAGLLIFFTLPQVRRTAAIRRAKERVRRKVKAGLIHPGSECCVCLTDAGWTQNGAGAEQEPWTLPWEKLRQVRRTEDYLFVGTTDDNWLIVPAKAFPNPQEFAEFSVRVLDKALTPTG